MTYHTRHDAPRSVVCATQYERECQDRQKGREIQVESREEDGAKNVREQRSPGAQVRPEDESAEEQLFRDGRKHPSSEHDGDET